MADPGMTDQQEQRQDKIAVFGASSTGTTSTKESQRIEKFRKKLEEENLKLKVGYENEKSKLKEQLVLTNDELSNLESKHVMLVSENKNTDKRATAYPAKLKELIKDKELVEKRNQQLEAETAELMEKNRTLSEKYQTSNDSWLSLKQSCLYQTEQIELKEREVERVQEKCHELGVEICVWNVWLEVATAFSEQHEKLKDKCDKVERELERLQEENKKLLQERTQLLSQLKKMEAEHDKEKSDFDNMLSIEKGKATASDREELIEANRNFLKKIEGLEDDLAKTKSACQEWHEFFNDDFNPVTEEERLRALADGYAQEIQDKEIAYMFREIDITNTLSERDLLRANLSKHQTWTTSLVSLIQEQQTLIRSLNDVIQNQRAELEILRGHGQGQGQAPGQAQGQAQGH